jgi:type IV secretion system protein VirB9
MKKVVIAILAVLAATACFADSTARTVKYSSHDIVAIKAKMRYTTMIELPANEKIMEVATGDKDYWIIDAVQNFCFLHPAKNGIQSNLNLITDHGNVYSFTLQEVSTDPDLKVIVQPTDNSVLASLAGAPKFVDASEAEAYRQEAQIAQTQARDAVNRFRSDYPTKQVKFDYHYKSQSPFNVTAMYHDDQFTYIKTEGNEKFSLYEMKDNNPNIVNFELRDGTYVIAKVLDKGYLEIGNKRLQFDRKQQ